MPLDDNSIKTWTEETIKELCKGLYEREEAMAISLLTVLSGQSVFLYGPPGTAKSLISRRIASVFSDSSYFEYLMQRFSTPEEVFGPVSIRELKNDNYVRITDNYLPTADIAFLDEIWKSSPAILNTLLTIINERKFKNGRVVEDVPLKAIIAASNEFPMENSGLEALYDRFIVRLCVNPVEQDRSFRKVISNNRVSSRVRVSEPLSTRDWECMMDRADLVEIPEDVFSILEKIREAIFKYNRAENIKPIYISDRRWQKAMYVVRTASMLCGSREVRPIDLHVLRHCLWSNLEDKAAIDGILDSILTSGEPLSDSRYEDWVEEYRDLVKNTEDLFSKYGKRANTVDMGGKECFSLTFSKGLNLRTETYYIPLDQLELGKSYNAFSNDPSKSASYHVDNISGNIVYISILGQKKMLDTSSRGISDPRLLRPSSEKLGALLDDLNDIISDAEYELQSDRIWASPFVECKMSAKMEQSRRDRLSEMKNQQKVAEAYMSKIQKNLR